MLTRDEALKLVEEHVKKDNLVKHVLSVEAIMRRCAEFLGEDRDKWGIVGLLHDIDFDEIEEPKYHGVLASDILKDKVDKETLTAIKSHNFENTGVMPQSRMECCLTASDAISGLIIACGLMMPSKKLADVKVESLKKKYKQKDFARNCNRENMLYCERAGIPMNKFYEISLVALQEVASDLGL